MTITADRSSGCQDATTAKPLSESALGPQHAEHHAQMTGKYTKNSNVSRNAAKAEKCDD
jgi:hypothetical protein